MLLAGEGVVGDCVVVVAADVGLLAGGDWARSGVATQNAAIIRRCFTIKCLLKGSASGLADAGTPEPKIRLIMGCEGVAVP